MALREKPYDFEMELYRVYPARIPKRPLSDVHTPLYAILNEPRAGFPAGTPVIIKKPEGRTGGQPRLVREAQTLRMLGGLHAPHLIEDHTDHDDCWFAETFVPHPTLGQAGVLSGELLDEFVRRSWRAMRATHALQISHRDIAPENILFDPVSRTVTFIDFGNGFVEGGVSVTSDGGLGNHAGFGAPEHPEGRGPDNSHLSQATDLWGWAATVAFACSGRAPYSTHRNTWAVQMDRKDPPDMNGLSEAYRTLLEPLFEYDIEERLEAIAHVEAHLPRPPLEVMSEEFDRATLLGIELGAEVQRANDSIRALVLSKSQLESELSNLGAAAAGNEAMAGRLTSLQAELDEQRQRAAEAAASAAAASKQADATQEEIKYLQLALVSANTLLEESQELVDELTQIAKEHTVARDSLAADLTVARAQAKAAADRLEEAQRRVSALEVEKGDLARRVVPGPRPGAVVAMTLGVVASLAILITGVVLSARNTSEGSRQIITISETVEADPNDPVLTILSELAATGRRSVLVRALDIVDEPRQAFVELELNVGETDLDVTPVSGALYLLARDLPDDDAGGSSGSSTSTAPPIATPEGALRASGFGVVVDGATTVSPAPDGAFMLLPMEPPETSGLNWGHSVVTASSQFGGVDAPFDTAAFQLPMGLVPLGLATVEDGALTGFGPLTLDMESTDRPWPNWSFPDDAVVVETADVADGTCLSPHIGLSTATLPGRLMVVDCDAALWRLTGTRADDECPEPTTGWVSDADYVTADDVHRCVEANPVIALSALALGSFFDIGVRRGPFLDDTTGVEDLAIAGLEVEVTNLLTIPWSAGVDDFRLLFAANPSGYQRGDADASTVVDVYTLGDFDGAAILPGSMRTVYGIRPDAVGHEYPEGNFTSNWFAGTLSEGQTFGGADADGDTMVFSLPSESPSIVGLAMVTGDKIIAFTELPAPVVSFEPQFFGYPDALVTMVPADMSESECYLEPPNRSDGESNFAGWVAVAPCDSGLVGLFRLDARVFFADDAEFPSSMFLAASALCPEGTSVAFVPSISGWEDGYRAVTCSVEL